MTDCYCDFESPEFYHDETRKARKKHQCAECLRWIEPGESYEHVRGKWGGYVGVYKTCQHCLDIRKFVENSVPCFCWGHGAMLENARDTIRFAYERAREEVRGLFVGYGRLVIVGRRIRQAQPPFQSPQETR